MMVLFWETNRISGHRKSLQQSTWCCASWVVIS